MGSQKTSNSGTGRAIPQQSHDPMPGSEDGESLCNEMFQAEARICQVFAGVPDPTQQPFPKPIPGYPLQWMEPRLSGGNKCRRIDTNF